MKLLVVDDHALIRDALRGVLADLLPDASILEARTAREALSHIDDNQDLDLVLLDLLLPDESGLELIGRLRKSHPGVCLVVVSASTDREDIARAFEQGVQGFIPKSAQREVMLSALRLIFDGGMYVPPEILVRAAPAPQLAQPQTLPTAARDLGLTARQVDVLRLMMLGKSNKAICRVLDLAEPTVKNHVTAILKALKATNRTEAVIAAGALGIRPPSEET